MLDNTFNIQYKYNHSNPHIHMKAIIVILLLVHLKVLPRVLARLLRTQAAVTLHSEPLFLPTVRHCGDETWSESTL